MANKPDLTPKQQMFCREYLVDLNGAQAAIRSGYSPATAKEQASRLLTNVNVAQRIQDLMEKRSEMVGVNSNRILSRLNSIGDVDIAEAYDNKGNLLPIHVMPIHIRKSIASIKVFEEFEGFGKERVKIGETREVKFWDKIKANELLGRHLKLFTDKVEHSGTVTLEQLVAGSNEEKKK